MEECFFCSVLNKKVKVFDVYENENFLAFVDAFPFVFGQVVIIAKQHGFSFINFDKIFQDFLDVVNKIVTAFFNLGYDGYHLLVNEGSASNFDHFYSILIPRKKDDGFSFNLKKLSLSEEEMQEMARLIIESIEIEEIKQKKIEKQEEQKQKEKEEKIKKEIEKFLERKRIP